MENGWVCVYKCVEKRSRAEQIRIYTDLTGHAPWTRQYPGTVDKGVRFVDVPDLAGVHMDVLRILLAILLPPLGVFLQVGIGLQFWLNILLTLLGYLPGIIHAVWIILRR